MNPLIPTTRTMRLILPALTMALALAAGTARAMDFTWTGEADNQWSNWQNWAPWEFGPPTTDDTATIGNGDSVMVDANFEMVNGLTITNGSSLDTNGFQAVVDGLSAALTLLSGTGTILIVDPNASNPDFDSFDTDLLTVDSGATVSMKGGVLEVDTGKLDLNSGADLYGWGSIDLEAVMTSVGSVFDNDGVLAVGEVGLMPLSRTLDIDVSDPDGRIDLDGAAGNGQVVIGTTGTLDIGAPLSDPFSDLMSFNRGSKLIMSAPWSADSNATLTVNNEWIFEWGPKIATIVGGAFNSTGIINIESGTLVLESDFTGTTVNVGGQGYDATVQFDGTATVTGLNLNGSGAGTANLTVNGDTTINQATFDWDADGSNTTTVGTDGVLTLNVDQVDLYDNNFNGTIDNNGEINVNLTNPLDTWTMVGILNMDAATGAVINTGNMIVTGEINVIDGSSAVLAGTRGPGPSGTARIAGNNLEFTSTADVNIAAGMKFIINGDTTFNGLTTTGEGELMVEGELGFYGDTVINNAVDLTNASITVGGDVTVELRTNSTKTSGQIDNNGFLAIIAILMPTVELVEGPGGDKGRIRFNPQGGAESTLELKSIDEEAVELLVTWGVIELVAGYGIVDANVNTKPGTEIVVTGDELTIDGNVNFGGGLIVGNDLVITGDIDVVDDTTIENTFFHVRNYANIAAGKRLTIIGDGNFDKNITLGGGGATLEVTNPVTLRGITSGNGYIAAITYPREPDVTNEGWISPGFSPGVIHVEGNYVQADTGVYEAEIGGLVRGDEYDCLTISGTATLGGTLDVQLIDGFMPEEGDAFDILDWSSLVGTFDNELLPELDGNLRWDIGDLYSSGELAVVTSSPGDANKDGNVDVSDLGILATHYGTSGCGWAQADFTGEGDVDVSDLGLLATHYGETALVASVPEPGTLTLLATCGLMLLGLGTRRRKR